MWICKVKKYLKVILKDTTWVNYTEAHWGWLFLIYLKHFYFFLRINIGPNIGFQSPLFLIIGNHVGLTLVFQYSN